MKIIFLIFNDQPTSFKFSLNQISIWLPLRTRDPRTCSPRTSVFKGPCAIRYKDFSIRIETCTSVIVTRGALLSVVIGLSRFAEREDNFVIYLDAGVTLGSHNTIVSVNSVYTNGPFTIKKPPKVKCQSGQNTVWIDLWPSPRNIRYWDVLEAKTWFSMILRSLVICKLLQAIIFLPNIEKKWIF